MDGASEVLSSSKPTAILNGHIPHLDNDDNSSISDTDLRNSTASISGNETLSNPLTFNGGTMDSCDIDPLNRTPSGSEVSLGVCLPHLPFPLPNIDTTLLNSEFSSATPLNLDCGDDSNGTGFSFDSSVFNDDLVTSAIWSIGPGGAPLPNLDADVPQDLELEEQSEFSLTSGGDSGTSLETPPEDNISEVIPPESNAVLPKENIDQVVPPDVGETPPDASTAPYKGVYCMEDGFEDDFSAANPNPFVDSSGMTIDPFLDLARNRALSTITEGFEDDDEDSRFARSGSFNPSSLDSVLMAFADAHEFVQLNSDPNSQQWKEGSNTWVVNFDTSATTAETAIPSSDWSNQDDDSPPTPKAVITKGEGEGERESPGGLEENIGSPVSDGNQVGVSPETVEGGLTKPVGDSWQSVSNEDDVVGGKTPSGSQHETNAKSAVVVSHVSSPTGDKINPSDAKFTANLEVSRTPERASSPDSDASGEYMKLADLHISPVSATPPASVGQEESQEAKKGSDVGTTQSPKSTGTVTSESNTSTAQSGTVSESTEIALHSTDVSKSDSHSSGTSKTGTGIAIIAGAAAVVNASTQGSTDDTSLSLGGENRNKTPVQAGEQDTTTSSTATESSTLDTSAQSQSQQQTSDSDQTSSSLDTGDRSRTWSNLDRGTRESNLDSSNLDAGLRAKKNQQSTPPSQQGSSHPATNLPVLSPLSPEHGTELNQQYEFLRRTLSHSQRRYSQRRKQQGEQGGNRRDPSETEARGRRYTSSAGGSSGGNVETRRKQTVGQLRDLLRNSETTTTTNRTREGREAHVDHHGRTYYMDHSTRTIAYNGGSREDRGRTAAGISPSRPNPQEMQTRREMLDRRYQSLHRSFRRSNEDRPSVARRQPRLAPSSSTTGGIDNMSLTLTPQEAEAMLRSQTSNRNSGGRSLLSRNGRTSSSVTERSSRKRSGSGSKTRWLFGRKSNKSISQQGTTSGEDDFLPVFSPTSEGVSALSQVPPTGDSEVAQEATLTTNETSRTEEGERLRSHSSTASAESESPLIPPSDSNSRAQIVGEAAAVSSVVAAAAVASSSDNEQELTRSTQDDNRELERSTEAGTRSEETTSEQYPLINVVNEGTSTAVVVEAEQNQQTPQESSSLGATASEELEAIPNASPAIGELGRQSTIVRASGLLSEDRDAAVRARQRARTRSQVGRDGRHRKNTDELTNEGATELDRRSQVLSSTGQEQVVVVGGSEDNESRTTIATAEPVRIERSKEDESKAEAEPKKKTRSSRRSQKVANRGLYVSPGLRFITRKDLYTFLTSAGHAGEEFFANRALMELVQRIRADNSLFEKYQHSRHLVTTLNQFADVKADLPKGWEKKLNKEGKVFFIDHDHELTTFVDPRLPLPNQQFIYTPIQSAVPARRISYDDTGLRPHHTTTVRHSQSLGSDLAVAPATTTTTATQGASLAPPSSSSPPLRENSGRNEPTAAGSGDNSGASSARASIVSESVAPPTYEEQVVAFFRQADIVAIISGRYRRGVRPQLRDIIAGIRMEGTTALERIQMSGSIATYELAIVLSLFEEEISRMNPQASIPPQPLPPALNVVPPQSSSPTPRTPSTPSTPGSPTKPPNIAALSTLQRQKLDFSTKLQNFKIMMTRVGFSQGSRLKFNIRRDHLLEDAYEHVMKSNLKHLQMKRLNISFKGEEGLDYGGPSREFFFLLSREIFNPYYGLFEYSANDTYTVQISPTSLFIHNNMEWFRFAGRIVGLVIAQGFLLDVFFTRTVYKSLLCKPPHIKDLEALEPAFYNSLVWIQENDPEPLDLTFTVEEEAFGQISSHELKQGGIDLPVTEDNKQEYIDLMLRWRLDRGVAKQMESFKKGFSEVMPVNLLYNFDAQELEFLTAGTLEIDVDDWRAHTEYRNGYHAAHQVVLWFWQAVEMFDNEQRLRLLQFVTGTSSVPFEGFKALRGSNGPKRFTIDFFNDVNAFPRTHTCFNRIDLPPYPSFEVLYEKLRFAVEEGGGFGIE